MSLDIAAGESIVAMRGSQDTHTVHSEPIVARHTYDSPAGHAEDAKAQSITFYAAFDGKEPDTPPAPGTAQPYRGGQSAR